MRGGKREGAGRKGYGPTKAYRLPIALEPQIIAMLEEFKAQYNNPLPPESRDFDSVTKSKEPVKPIFPILSKEQIKRLRNWLVETGLVKTHTEARKATETPRMCKETWMKLAPFADEEKLEKISEIYDLYCVDQKN